MSGSLSRSKTMPSLGRPKISRKLSNINCNFNTDRLKAAKEQAEKAIKVSRGFGYLIAKEIAERQYRIK